MISEGDKTPKSMSEIKTFTKEISFINPAFFDTEANRHIEKEITKTAKFKELSRTDRDQRKLQFMLMSVFKSNEKNIMELDSDKLADITEIAVDVLLISDNDFTEIDKQNLLNDNGSIIMFGLWFLAEKISPFFSHLITK